MVTVGVEWMEAPDPTSPIFGLSIPTIPATVAKIPAISIPGHSTGMAPLNYLPEWHKWYGVTWQRSQLSVSGTITAMSLGGTQAQTMIKQRQQTVLMRELRHLSGVLQADVSWEATTALRSVITPLSDLLSRATILIPVAVMTGSNAFYVLFSTGVHGVSQGLVDPDLYFYVWTRTRKSHKSNG